MADFPSITPTYGLRKRSSPRQVVVQLGDGYEHRTTFGLNTSPKIYDLTFTVSETEADVIEAFLESRKRDNSSFNFTPPAESSSKSGTYNQSTTTITVTVTNHGFAIGDVINVNFSGSITDGDYTVKTDPNANTFTLESSSSDSATVTDSPSLTITKSGSGKYICDTWVKSIPYNNRATIQATFRQVFEP